jgi:hypothetical protein
MNHPSNRHPEWTDALIEAGKICHCAHGFGHHSVRGHWVICDDCPDPLVSDWGCVFDLRRQEGAASSTYRHEVESDWPDAYRYTPQN